MVKCIEPKLQKLQGKDKFILNLLSMWLFVDMCNGFFLNTGIGLPISQIFKGFIFLFVILKNINIGSINKVCLFLALYLPFYLCITLFAYSSISSTIVLTLKPITTLTLYFYLSNLFKKYDNNIVVDKFISIISINAVVFFVNILLGFWGIGYRPYEGEEAMGFCGFFYSPNELSGVVAVLFPLILCYVKITKSLLYYLIAIIVMGCSCYIMTTKAPLVVFVLSVFTISYCYGKRLEKTVVITALIAIIITATTLVSIVMSSDYGLFTRLNYFIEKNGLLWAITSGRLDYWAEESVELYSSNIFNILFGLGGGRTVEMDPYDVLLNYGYVGLLVLLYIYYTLLFQVKKCSSNPFTKSILISNYLLVFMSVIAGHIFFSSMAGLFIALSNSLLHYKINNFRTHENLR